MKFSPRFFLRIAFLLLVLALFAIGVVLAWFTSWRSDKLAELESNSEVAKTAAGPVEFLSRGEGPPVLVFHGVPGGYDQAILLGSGLLDAGFQVIAPSRPGYLRTPLATGLLPEQQADAMAALLDLLGIPQVAVLGSSGGAPAAIFFAAKFPGRTRALVLLSPVTRKFEPSKEVENAELGRIVLNGLTGDIGSWLAVETAEKDPRKLLNVTVDALNAGDLSQKSDVIETVLHTPAQLEWFRGLVGSFAPLSPRESGARNDLIQIRALAELPLAKVTAPTLVVQGSLDLCVPLVEVEAAVKKFPKATLFPVAGAGHLVEIGPQAVEVQKTIIDFLNQHAGGPGSKEEEATLSAPGSVLPAP